jgi:hypothetical protein
MSQLAQERRAWLLLGHATDGINVFQKLMMMVRREVARSIVRCCGSGKILILMRGLIGKPGMGAVEDAHTKPILCYGRRTSSSRKVAACDGLNKHLGAGAR